MCKSVKMWMTMMIMMITMMSRLVVFLCLLSYSHGFNIDTVNFIRHSGSPGSMFGFSVAEHKERGKNWVLVGAPEAQTRQPGVTKGGAVFRCEVNRDDACEEIQFDGKGNNNNTNGRQIDKKSNQWFGATVRSSGETGVVLACAPRYVWFSTTAAFRRDPVGTCFIAKNHFSEFSEYSPCRTRNWGYHRQGSCQAGLGADVSKVIIENEWEHYFSTQNHLDGNRLYVGAPGSWYWQGQIYDITSTFKMPTISPDYSKNHELNLIEYESGNKDGRRMSGAMNTKSNPVGGGQLYAQNPNKRSEVLATSEGSPQDDDSYLGYSVASGDFEGRGEGGVAVGMPRGAGLFGKVVLYSVNLTNLQNLTGHQLGSYFSYSLAAADIDGDGLDDIIVGAPLHTDLNNNEGKYETGRVYIYFQQPAIDNAGYYARFNRFEFRDGKNSKGRFGLSVAALGDTNKDGFGDFAVGAPYDGIEGRGAVYIYHGRRGGVRESYSQVIRAEDLSVHTSTFGFSIAGGLDMDDNQYPDMVVGAYDSDTALFFRSRPVVRMVDARVSFNSKSKQISLEEENCTLRDYTKVPCLYLQACLKYDGVELERQLDVDIGIALDSKKPKTPRMFFLNEEGKNVKNDTVRLNKGELSCKSYYVYVKPNVRDKLTPLEAELRYNVNDAAKSQVGLGRRYSRSLSPVLDANEVNIQRDSLSIQKNCGPDNICIPDLQVTTKKSVSKYLLGSGERFSLDVQVENRGEDAFEAMYNLQVPPGMNYINIERLDSDRSIPVQCSAPSPLTNNTLRCDIGNPLPKEKLVHFKVLLQPFHREGMKSSYNFVSAVNSTNPEDDFTTGDNVETFTIPIWVETDLILQGSSHPPDVHYNMSHYDGNIRHEVDIGPQVFHVYNIRNKGPSDILEAQAVFLWPSYTLSDEHLLYLLEQPETSGNVKCEYVENVNEERIELDRKRKSFLDSAAFSASQLSGHGRGSGKGVSWKGRDGAGGGGGEGGGRVAGVRGGASWGGGGATVSGGSRWEGASGKSEGGGRWGGTRWEEKSGEERRRYEEGTRRGGGGVDYESGDGSFSHRTRIHEQAAASGGGKYEGGRRLGGGGVKYSYGGSSESRFVESSGGSRSSSSSSSDGAARMGGTVYSGSDVRVSGVSSGTGGGDSFSGGHVFWSKEKSGSSLSESGVWDNKGNSVAGQEESASKGVKHFEWGATESGSGASRASSDVGEHEKGVGVQDEKRVQQRPLVFNATGYSRARGKVEGSANRNFSDGTGAFRKAYVQNEFRTVALDLTPREGSNLGMNVVATGKAASGEIVDSEIGGVRPEVRMEERGRTREYEDAINRELEKRRQEAEAAAAAAAAAGFIKDNSKMESSRGTVKAGAAGFDVTERRTSGQSDSNSRGKISKTYATSGNTGGTFAHSEEHFSGGSLVRGSINKDENMEAFNRDSNRKRLETDAAEGRTKTYEIHGSVLGNETRTYKIMSNGTKVYETRYDGNGPASGSRTYAYEDAMNREYERKRKQEAEAGADAVATASSSSRESEFNQGSYDARHFAKVDLRAQEEALRRIYEVKRQEAEAAARELERIRLESEAGGPGYHNARLYETVESLRKEYEKKRLEAEAAAAAASAAAEARAAGATGSHQYATEFHYRSNSSWESAGGPSAVDASGGAVRSGSSGYDGEYLKQLQAEHERRLKAEDDERVRRLEDERLRSTQLQYYNTSYFGAGRRVHDSSRTLEVDPDLGYVRTGAAEDSGLLGAKYLRTRENLVEEGNDSRYKKSYDRSKRHPTLLTRFPRQVTPGDSDLKSSLSCGPTKCTKIKCTVGPLTRGQEAWVAFRGRIWVNTLKKVGYEREIMLSSLLASQVTRLPHIGEPHNAKVETYEVFSELMPQDVTVKPEVAPLWIIVLSACAGTLILFLLSFLLWKLGFFKRNRPSSAPEKQPLNRNGYHTGDEQL